VAVQLFSYITITTIRIISGTAAATITANPDPNEQKITKYII